MLTGGGQPGTGPTGQGQPHGRQHPPQTVAAARPPARQPGDLLDEGLLPAGVFSQKNRRTRSQTCVDRPAVGASGHTAGQRATIA
jgi:hypothetical protein